jgi:mono/diheme cytochrome c family protein
VHRKTGLAGTGRWYLAMLESRANSLAMNHKRRSQPEWRWGALAAVAVGVGAALWIGRLPPQPPRSAAPQSAAAAEAPPSYQPRPLSDVVYEATPERVERGRYLVEGVMQCFVCHSARDWTKPGAPPVEGKEGAGTVWWDKPWLVAPNLTPDGETGIGRWTDDMLGRSIREGVAHDGRVLYPQMWSNAFHGLADEDLAAVVVYLRSRPPVRNPLPTTRIPAERAAHLPTLPPLLEPVPMPDLEDPVARARYYVQLADCSGCHSSWYTPRNPGLFAGGNPIGRPGGTVYSANITRDPSGIPYYDEALFREVLRTGRVKARELNGAMPWVAFRHLNDADLDALFRFFRDVVPPARHSINNLDPPTDCRICGGKHPLGDRNVPVEFHPVPLAPGLAAQVVGRYAFADGSPVVFAIEQGRLVARFGENEAGEVFTEDGLWFHIRGEPDVFQFDRDPAGRVTGFVASGVDIVTRQP